jgi:hypothetical protein
MVIEKALQFLLLPLKGYTWFLMFLRLKQGPRRRSGTSGVVGRAEALDDYASCKYNSHAFPCFPCFFHKLIISFTSSSSS